MAALHEQAQGIINVCKIALAGKTKDQRGVDNQTIAIAQEILKQAKAELPDDKVLALVNLEPPVHLWTPVLSAMEMVDKSLPSEKDVSLAERMKKGRQRVAELDKPIDDAIAVYRAALTEYEQLAQKESPSYSMIETPKLKIADALLERRGIPTGPAA